MAAPRSGRVLGGVELADGARPTPHTRAQRPHAQGSVATNIGGTDVNDCGGEPVSGEGPLSVCSCGSLFPSVRATQKTLRSLRASPVSTTRHRSANSGQNHNHYLPSTIIVGGNVSQVTARKRKLQPLLDVGTRPTVKRNDPNTNCVCLHGIRPLRNDQRVEEKHRAKSGEAACK